MALPILPTSGQDPWFTERNNWDISVKSEIEGRLSTTGMNSFFRDSSGVIPASAFGVVGGTGADQSEQLHAAFQYAEDQGGGKTIQLPGSSINVGPTFSLSGYSSCLRGASTSTVPGTGPIVQTGTVLYATGQTGPVLDFTGFKYPRGMRGRLAFSDFAISGDGTTGANKKGILMDTGVGGSSSIDFRGITIYNTGGVGLHVKDHYLSEFYGVTVFNPVDCVTTNTPYVLLEGANGNRYFGLGFRSLEFNPAVPDTPAAGALRLIPGTSFQHHRSVFYGTWFENNHLPTDGALVVTQSNAVTFDSTQFFDCFKVSGTTGTAHFRLETPASQNYGGNIIRGDIPGKGSTSTEIDCGVDLRQSNNRIEGTKGAGGTNVIIASGVSYTWAELGGAVLAGNNIAFTDNSGNNTNTLIDSPQGTWQLGERSGGGWMKVAGAFQGDKLNSLGTLTANWAANIGFGHNIFRVTLGANIAMTAVSGVTSSQVGRRLVIMLVQDATGSRTMTWPSNVKFAGATTPTLSTTAGRTDTFTFVYDGTNWIETARSIGVA